MNRIKAMCLAAAAGTLALSCNCGWAASLVTGDVIASVGSGRFNHFSSTGVLKGVMDTGAAGFTTGGAYRSGTFYGTHFSNGRVYTFDQSGAAPLTSFSTGGVSPESIAFNAAGDMYVGHADGDRDIRKFTTAGTLLSTYNVAVGPRGSDWIDLAGDQRTLHYTSEGRLVYRFDVQTGQLSNFATLPGSGEAYALRLLSDGGLLVADDSNIKRLNSAGTVIQTYDAVGQDSWFALNLDPDGQTFWSGDFGTDQIFRFNIATGAQVGSFSSSGTDLFGLTVVGEQTAANPVPLPAAAWAGMALMGAIGTNSIRKRRKEALC
jgi:DNA-binding beta-propeller fold protein YncE